MKKATFAAGCFWGVENKFSHLQGVEKTKVGYTGGHVSNPSYEQVCSDTTGHAEAVEIIYNPQSISYDQLLNFSGKYTILLKKTDKALMLVLNTDLLFFIMMKNKKN